MPKKILQCLIIGIFISFISTNVLAQRGGAREDLSRKGLREDSTSIRKDMGSLDDIKEIKEKVVSKDEAEETEGEGTGTAMAPIEEEDEEEEDAIKQLKLGEDEEDEEESDKFLAIGDDDEENITQDGLHEEREVIKEIKERKKEAALESESSFVVGIGFGEGGLNALAEILQVLPSNTQMAYILISTENREESGMMVNMLSNSTEMPVIDAQDGMAVEPNHIYIIPSDFNAMISDSVLRFVPQIGGESSMSIDHFLNSLAEDQGANAIGIILSGSVPEGALGLKEIKAAGGTTFVQDGATAEHDMMPTNAVAIGGADFIMSPGEIAGELSKIGSRID